jgi:hypothetical protein
MTDAAVTPAHKQHITHSYTISYPAHEPRQGDPNYVDFEAYRKRTVATAKCAFGVEIDDFEDCVGGLELHHAHIEFAMQNGIDLTHLEAVYPGVSDPYHIGAWVESGANLTWLCEKHHRSAPAGVHSLSASDYEASRFTSGVFVSEVKTADVIPAVGE